jgi:chromosomal replication initiation ATPase DnaA
MDVAGAIGKVSAHDMTSKGRSKGRIAYARQVAMYLAHVVGQMSLNEISRAFRRDRTTVAHACRMIEDRREDLRFDAEIEKLEQKYRERLNWLRQHENIIGRRSVTPWKRTERDGLSPLRRRSR